eukprot:jgi/Orpsp1_1/1180569/evm.model.c7180000073946.1
MSSSSKYYTPRITQMNSKFENLIYNKFWTKEVQEEWKQMIPRKKKIPKNEYKKGFPCLLYILGVYKNNNIEIGNKFSNGYVINNCPKEFLKEKIINSHKNFLSLNNLENIWLKFQHLRTFLFWAAKRTEIKNYCHLNEPLSEQETDSQMNDSKLNF